LALSFYISFRRRSTFHTRTQIKNAEVSDVVARDVIGHDSEAISRNYTHIEMETKRKAGGFNPRHFQPRF
jgi:hypothetical protein